MPAKPVLLLALVSIASTVACGNPFVLLPGRALEGAPAATPESWSFTDAVETVQLETRPEDPYSVNIWVIAMDEHLYVHAGANRSTWVENIEADPKVRLRVNDSIYELAAARVAAQDEFDRFSDAYDPVMRLVPPQRYRHVDDRASRIRGGPAARERVGHTSAGRAPHPAPKPMPPTIR